MIGEAPFVVHATMAILFCLSHEVFSFQISVHEHFARKSHTKPSFTLFIRNSFVPSKRQRVLSRELNLLLLHGWVQQNDGEWKWEEDDESDHMATTVGVITNNEVTPTERLEMTRPEGKISVGATPTLPSGKFRPKQSLGQNYLRDGNTVAKIVRAFQKDVRETLPSPEGFDVIEDRSDASLELGADFLKHYTGLRAVELGPGAGALTDVLVKAVGYTDLQCIEIDERAVELLAEKHPSLFVQHKDVLQVDYPALAEEEGGPLSIIGNLPYYITSQILFALADASHSDSIRSATVTMQWEVAQRIVAPTSCKDYGILSVVFQLYADCKIHFKIPPTVFYPQPKVDSALIGLHFLGPTALQRRLAGVNPSNLRSVVTTTFQQRRKTVKNGLRNLALNVFAGDKERVKLFFESPPLPLPDIVKEAKETGDQFAMRQELPQNWSSKRPEELSSGQFIEITRLLFGPTEACHTELGTKVWRKLKHGAD